jgi:asparagine synthase (glutamine-hydrolysing)
MSGIVGIINLDGAPVDRPLLERMTGFMAFRGPDAQNIWINGRVGFGHTMLRTTQESQKEQQPCTLDGEVWITADARVDGRDDLVRLLAAKGRGDLKSATDPELILHAYHAWGDDCVEHLIGDFAFAIWDGSRKRLFCARDHFGVKPFFYALLPDYLVLSNTLNCVRLHPDVSDELNPLAIDEFLRNELNRDPASTVYAKIHRLAAGHRLRWSESDGNVRVERYWSLPVDEPIRYRRASDYVDHFLALLRLAVTDRLRTRQVGISMSGGLDSTTVAAMARQVLAESPEPFDLRAHTVVYDRLIPDRERLYAGLAAKALGIPIHFLPADDYEPFDGGERSDLFAPEPSIDPLRRLEVDSWSQIAALSRVVLCGDGPDALLRFPFRSHMAALLEQRRYARLLADLVRYVGAYRGIPGRILLRSRTKELDTSGKQLEASPLRDQPARRRHRHEREVAWEMIAGSFWSYRLERSDAGTTRVPVEPRFAFFDLRLVRYLLALPPIPWCLNKTLFRRAMRGLLPRRVRLRPKAPLAGDPVLIQWQQGAARWIDHYEPTADLAHFLPPEMQSLKVDRGERAAESLWRQIRPISLDLWLSHRIPVTMNR